MHQKRNNSLDAGKKEERKERQAGKEEVRQTEKLQPIRTEIDTVLQQLGPREGRKEATTRPLWPVET